MAIQTGPVTVEGPRTRDRYGLFAVAEREDLPPHAATGGVQWITGNCGDSTGYAIVCQTDGARASKPPVNEPSYTVASPFVVYASRLCGTVGFTAEEQQRLAVQKLKATEQSTVEAVFGASLFGADPGLANNPDVLIAPGAPTNFTDAIGLLEQAFYANYGQQGIIHVPFRAGEHMASQHLLYADSEHPMPGNARVWRTAVGSAVSIGNYPGLSPVGAAPAAGHQWIYITPPVKIWSTPDSGLIVSPLRGALNRTTNQETWLAERFYAVGFECDTVYAIDATLPTTTTT